ncbi:MAG: response regulator [Porticoccaceae bacterium]
MHALREALKKVKRPKILHIEDDLDIIQITEDVVGDVAEFSSVPSLQGAKKLLKHNRYDLVILDLGLEDGSGVDLLDELKSLCPVVIFSAKIPNHLSGKVSAALTKSITSNDLLKATIHNVLNEELNGSK